MKRAGAIYMFFLCLQICAFAKYARVPKRLLKLSAQEEKSRRFVRKNPTFKTIKGPLPVLQTLPDRSEFLEDSLEVPNTQIVSTLLPDLRVDKSSHNAQNNAEVFAAIPSNLNTTSFTLVSPEALEVPSPLYNIQESQIMPTLLTDTLPIHSQIMPETPPVLPYPENIWSSINHNLLSEYSDSEFRRLPRNNGNSKTEILKKFQPIVKFTLPEMKVLPILTDLPVITTLPKVNLMTKAKPQAELVPLINLLSDEDIEENESILESLIVDITEEVKYEILEQKPSKSPILHKVQKIEEMKRGFISVDKQGKNKNTDDDRSMNFRDYYRLVQEKAESFILKPK